MSISTVTAGNIAKASEMNEIINSINTVEVTGNTTISDIEGTRHYRIQGAYTITLPTVADNEGVEFWFWNEGDHASVIDGEGAETLTFRDSNTETSITFSKEGDYLHIVSDGSTWIVLDGKWSYTTGSCSVADAGGAYTDGACTYNYWYNNNLLHMHLWGWIECDNTDAYVQMDITSPLTFATVLSITCGYVGYKASDPSSLLDSILSGTQAFAGATFTDTTSITVFFRKPGGNFVNTRRHVFSMYIMGTI